MTPDQLERAALHYCKLMGVDPEQLVMHGPPPNPDGTVNTVAIYTPRWKLLTQELHHTWAMNEALKEGMRDPRVEALRAGAFMAMFPGPPIQGVSDTTDA